MTALLNNAGCSSNSVLLPLGQVQVVPDCVSPKLKVKRNSSKHIPPPQNENDSPNINRRALPNSTAGMKPLELFSGDDIFARREE